MSVDKNFDFNEYIKNVILEQEDYQDPGVLFPDQQEVLRSLNDELETKKQGSYASFVDYLAGAVSDPKVKALLTSGLFDGSEKDDAVQVEEIDIPVTQLVPTQSEIGLADSLGWASENNPDGAAKLASAPAGTVADVGGRIITADGRFIVDGHHRWSQVYLLNPEAKIPAYNLIAPDSPIPGMSATSTGQDFLKMSQIAIAAVDGTVPRANADTATDVYRTKGDRAAIKTIIEEIIPEGSRFAAALEAQIAGPDADPGAEEQESDMDMYQAGEEQFDVDTSEYEGKPQTQATAPDVIEPGDPEKEDIEKTLSELFLREFIALTPAGGSTSGYSQVIDRVVSNAIKLYNGTAETAKTMTSRSEMPQYDKGGSDPKAKIDALKSGQIDWNPPYDKGDMKNVAESSRTSKQQPRISEALIRSMIKSAITKVLEDK
jgi:hypothetical protein